MTRLPSRLLYPLALLLCLTAAAQQADPELGKIKERELQEVRVQIDEITRSMERRAAERNKMTGELQAAEEAISERRLKLTELERQLQFSERRKSELEGEIGRRQAQLDAEAAQLGSQVRAAYMTGSQERIKLLLNQQDPAALGRQLKYYEYLSRFRAANILSVTQNLNELSALHQKVAEEEASLERLAGARRAELAELDGAQSRRRELLASLDSQQQAEGSAIKRLASQEADLQRLINELTAILSDYPISSEEPFTKFKGRLTWPVAGDLLHDYGEGRAGGQLKWDGVVLAAPRGREVRSVYHGRVIFADWLAGMGLLVIVDHGEGYRTLYGYNETVLKSPGDWVAPGDVIATVGDSGGQSQSGLYFEVRQGIEPVNPRNWVSRKPKTG